jgi:hypothetical protein
VSFKDVEDLARCVEDEHDDVEEDGEGEHEARDLSKSFISPFSPQTGRSLPVVF